MEVPDQVALRLDWGGIGAVPVSHVNQLAAQVGPPSQQGVPDGVYIAVGSVQPPLVVGDAAQRAARVAELQGGSIAVTVSAYLHMSRDTLGDVIKVLQTAADQYDNFCPTPELTEQKSSDNSRPERV